jgi:type II secretory pathway pseudopilin PulG
MREVHKVTDAMRRALRRDLSESERGMTLVEVLVACTVLMILSAGVVGMMLTAFKTTRNDRVRVAAANLAARELEIVRQSFNSGPTAVTNIVDPLKATLTNPDPLSGVSPAPSVVDGVSYTIVRTVEVQVLGPGVSACDGGSTVAHPSYAVTATVTWPRMGATRPIVNETVLTPPKGVVQDSTYGYLALKVTDSRSAAVSGISAQASGPAGTVQATTDISGCAVMAISTPGTYTATLATPGYVDFSFATSPVLTPITVAVGALTVKPMTYDRAAELDATFTTTAGHSVPVTPPYLTLYNTGIQPSKTKVMPSTGTTTQLKNLWPFVSGYTVWAGSCTDADPAASGGTRAVPVVVSQGGIGTTQVQLTPLDVLVLNNAGLPAANQTVTAVEQTTPGCLTDKTLTLGITNALGKLATSVPMGKWMLKVGTTSGSAFNVTAAAASAEVDLP